MIACSGPGSSVAIFVACVRGLVIFRLSSDTCARLERKLDMRRYGSVLAKVIADVAR